MVFPAACNTLPLLRGTAENDRVHTGSAVGFRSRSEIHCNRMALRAQPDVHATAASPASLAMLLEQNMAAMQAVKLTHICAPEVSWAGTSASSSSTRSDAVVESASSTSPREEVDPHLEHLRGEHVRLQEELQLAHERTLKAGELERKKHEMHSLLLRTAHDEAIKAALAARQESADLREQLEQQARGLEAERDEAAQQRRTLEAEVGLLASEVQRLRARADGSDRFECFERLSTSQDGPSAVPDGVAVRLPGQPPAGATKLTAPRELPGRPAPETGPGSATGGMHSLLEIGLKWSSGNAVDGSEPRAGAARLDGQSPASIAEAVARLERLEHIAEAAEQRFEALARDHADLQRRHAELLSQQQRG